MLKPGTPLLHTQTQNSLLLNFLFYSRSRDTDETPPKNAILPYSVGFDEAKLFSQVEIKKKSVRTYFSLCLDEDNKKPVTKAEQKWRR